MARCISDTHTIHWEIYYAHPHSRHMLFLDKQCQSEPFKTDSVAEKIYWCRYQCFKVFWKAVVWKLRSMETGTNVYIQHHVVTWLYQYVNFAVSSPVQSIYLEQSTAGYSPVNNTETISKTTEDIRFLLGLHNMIVCALSWLLRPSSSVSKCSYLLTR